MLPSSLLERDPLFHPARRDARRDRLQHRTPDAPVCSFVRASDTMANLTDLLLHPGSTLGHYVCVPPPYVRRGRRGALVVLGASTTSSMSLTQLAAALGYDAVSLSWWNDPTPASASCWCPELCRYKSASEARKMQFQAVCDYRLVRMRLYGEGHPELSHAGGEPYFFGPDPPRAGVNYALSQSESVQGRLLALYRFLASIGERDGRAGRATSPYSSVGSPSWSQYLGQAAAGGKEEAKGAKDTSSTTSGSSGSSTRLIAWERIAVLGHSRGTPFALELARRFLLSRAILIDGPTSYSLPLDASRAPTVGGQVKAPASWVTNASNSATPADRVYGLTAAYGEGTNCAVSRLNWAARGLPGTAYLPRAATFVPGSSSSSSSVSSTTSKAGLLPAGKAAKLLADALDGARQIIDTDACRGPDAIEGDAGGHSSSSGGSHAPAHWCLVQGGVRDDPTADPGPDGGRRVAIQAAWRYLLTNDAPPSSVAARRVADDGLIEGGRLLKGGSCS